MSRGTIQRSVRIPDDVWLAAKERADAEGVTLSEVIREALIAFTDRPKSN